MVYEAEMPGMMLSLEQLQMICLRYYTVGRFARGKRVMEVGCGAGLGLGYLAKKAERVIGTDYSLDNIRCAKRHYGGRIELLVQDAHHLAFKDNCFDVILAMEVIFYLCHISKFLDECHRVLRRGGHLIICLPNKDVPGFLKSELSYRYYSVPELHSLLGDHRFDAKVFGAFPIPKSGAEARFQSAVRKNASKVLEVVPTGGQIRNILDKYLLHKIVLKAELEEEDMKILENIKLVPLPGDSPNFRYRILYVVAQALISEARSNSPKSHLIKIVK